MQKEKFNMYENAKIIIAMHKDYDKPDLDLYLPCQVGAEGKEGFNVQRDNEGENISSLNPYFCELTAVYFAWKNLNYDYIGLVHYRRYFKGSFSFKVNNKVKKILCRKDLEKFKDTDVILPKKRKYYIETLYNHYKHTMYVEPLDVTFEIIKEKYPSYYMEFEKIKHRRSAHMFNMFIMKWEVFDKYCNFLFDVLFELKNRIDVTKYDSFHARFFGRISELLLDVWLNVNNIQYKEIGVRNIEKVNWFKKGFSFLKSKFTGKKYEKSF